MNADQLGPAVSMALFVTGCWIGWRSARLRGGEAPIRLGLAQAFGFGRGTPRPLRVFAVAFGASMVAFLLRLLSEQLSATVLAYVAVAIIAFSIGVGWGAMMRWWAEWWGG
jgi:hypothetical protein